MNTAYVNEFKKYNLKVTTARSAIYMLALQARKPIDVMTFSECLEKLGIKADQATIYRTLQVFVDKGLLRRIEFLEGKFRYESATLPHHHHLICTQCGAIDDIQQCGMNQLEKIIQKNTSFIVTAHDAEFFGLCKPCNDKNKQNPKYS